MGEKRALEVVRVPDRCPFTRTLGGHKFVCTKTKHEEHQGHNMVSEKEARKHGWL